MYKLATFIALVMFLFFASFEVNNLNLTHAMETGEKETQYHKNPIKLLWDVKTLDLENGKNILQDKLKEANIKGNKTYLAIESVFKEGTYAATTVWELSIFNKLSNEIVGHIQFRMRTTNILPDENKDKIFNSLEKKGVLYKAYIDYIKISPLHQSRGYGKDSLQIFNNLMDAIEADFTDLQLDSKTPYTGSIYQREGYHFDPLTIQCINNTFGDNKGNNTGVNEFLKDTSRPLKGCGAVLMRRYNNE